MARLHALSLAIAIVLVAVAVDVAAQWTSDGARDGRVLLAGHWESCREADGTRRERIYDHYEHGVGLWEFHMGPSDEFALFRGVQDVHRDHASADNLLGPAFHAGALETATHSRQWHALGLWISVVVAGGSADDCDGGSEYPSYSYRVLVRRDP